MRFGLRIAFWRTLLNLWNLWVMKMRLYGTSLLVCLLAVACNDAKFGGASGDKKAGAVIPATGQQNDKNDPLNVSELEKNIPKAEGGGPVEGFKEETTKVVNLDCDTSAGVIIDIGPENPGMNPDPTDPIDPTEPSDPTNPDPTDPGTEPDPFAGDLFELLGKPGKVDIGTDGKPIGDYPKPEKPPGKELPPDPLPDDNKAVATVKGEFCPEAKNTLAVLFVVDMSGSMGRHVPEHGGPELPGNDPQIADSCGRLRGAQAIVDRILAEKAPSDEVYIGMVPFAGGIVTNKILHFEEVETFAQLMNKDTFCQYVVQAPSFGYDPINPGGIEGPSGLFGIGRVDSSTNYRAAFHAAESMLTGVYGRKVVYFISDGQPTSGGPDPILAGIEAGAELRQNVDNLQLNALLLGQTGPEARRVLEDVAGSPNRVRDADDADQLADQILNFPEAAIDDTTGLATLTVQPYPTEDLGLQYFGPHPQKPGVWLYETQPFVLVGIPGQTVENRVDISAQGVDGSTHSAVVRIMYTRPQ